MTTFKGNEVTLVGTQVKVGEKAPNFTVLANDLTEKSLTDYEGIKVISVIPSIDTGLCDTQTRKFNEEVSKIEGVTVLTISNDLPFAQRRWCASSGLENVVTLSDHRDLSFGEAFGTLIKEMRLLTRSVFVIDENNVVTYAEYLPEATNPVNFEAALEAAKKLTK